MISASIAVGGWRCVPPTRTGFHRRLFFLRVGNNEEREQTIERLLASALDLQSSARRIRAGSLNPVDTGTRWATIHLSICVPVIRRSR